MGWKSTLLIFFLAALTVAVCARNGRTAPNNRRGRDGPTDRSEGRGGAGISQIETNLEQPGGLQGDGGPRNEGRFRSREHFSDGHGRQGLDRGEVSEFRGHAGFRRRGGKPSFGQGGRREGGQHRGPEGDMSPMPFASGGRSDRVNEINGDETFPGRHHGRHMPHHHHHHHRQHHHARRNESEESEEGQNNGTSIFPFRFRHHGNRHYHHGKYNDSKEYEDGEDNNGTRISIFENAPFGGPFRRRQPPCKRNRTEEENELSDRLDQSGRHGGRRGGGGNGHHFQRPGKDGRYGNSENRPFGRRGGRKPGNDEEDTPTTIVPTTQTREHEIDDIGTDMPQMNEEFVQ